MSAKEQKVWSYLDHPSDITLIFHFGKIYYWKELLVKYSGFHRFEIKENTIDHSAELNISEKAVKFVLNWINNNELEIDDELWREILILSSQWQIEILLEKMRIFIENIVIDNFQDLELLCTHRLITTEILENFICVYVQNENLNRISQFSEYLCPKCMDKSVIYLIKKLQEIAELRSIESCETRSEY